MPTGRPLVRALSALAAVVCLSSCGGSSPTQPSPQPPVAAPPAQQAPTVTGISPSFGSTLGGTTVTITGTNFAAGAVVTVGGAPATEVVVQSSTTITARTAQRTSGSGDVTVTVGALTGRLSNAFTFAAPSIQLNTPPVIASVYAQDQRPRTPRNFADLDDVVDLTALVSDGETPLSDLRYEWSATAGRIEGSGPTARWRAPLQFPTPGKVRLGLTVVERYETLNAQGQPVAAEHRVTGGVDVNLHDSAKEIRDIGYEFMVDFSLQKPLEVVLQHFSMNCRGREDERRDVVYNQETYTITGFSIGASPAVTVAFDSVCQYLPSRNRFGDGCAWFPARWENVTKAGGIRTTASGFEQVNAVYEDGRWRLCDTDWQGTGTFRGRPYRK